MAVMKDATIFHLWFISTNQIQSVYSLGLQGQLFEILSNNLVVLKSFWPGLSKMLLFRHFIYIYIYFVILGFELRAYTFSHSTSPFL
jgi:hypothetical protein